MRARYAAFARGRGDFLIATHDAPAAPNEAAEVARWARSVTWLGLEVMSRTAGGPTDDVGQVEFTARYLEDGAVVSLHERSSFRRDGGRWRYVSGTPEVHTAKVERNAPCPCGSGRKFKQCHA